MARETCLTRLIARSGTAARAGPGRSPACTPVASSPGRRAEARVLEAQPERGRHVVAQAEAVVDAVAIAPHDVADEARDVSGLRLRSARSRAGRTATCDCGIPTSCRRRRSRSCRRVALPARGRARRRGVRPKAQAAARSGRVSPPPLRPRRRWPSDSRRTRACGCRCRRRPGQGNRLQTEAGVGEDMPERQSPPLSRPAVAQGDAAVKAADVRGRGTSAASALPAQPAASGEVDPVSSCLLNIFESCRPRPTALGWAIRTVRFVLDRTAQVQPTPAAECRQSETGSDRLPRARTNVAISSTSSRRKTGSRQRRRGPRARRWRCPGWPRSTGMQQRLADRRAARPRAWGYGSRLKPSTSTRSHGERRCERLRERQLGLAAQLVHEGVAPRRAHQHLGAPGLRDGGTSPCRAGRCRTRGARA